MMNLVLASALKGALLLLLAAVVTRALASRPAALRHWIWTLALGGALALPVASALVPRWSVGGERVAALLPVVLGGSAPAALAGSEPMQEVSGTVTLEPVATARRPLHLGAIAWGTGSAALLGLVALGWASAYRRLRRANKPGRGVCSARLDALVRRTGAPGGVRLLISPEAVTPFATGLLRPTIVLPAGAEDWPAERLDAALLHELAHVRRRDCATQLMGELARALHWWNPLLWLACRQLRALREHAADDLVIGWGLRASDYAGHLVELARTLPSPRGALVAMCGQSKLERRITGLLDPARPRSAVGRCVSLASCLGLLALVIPLAAARPGLASFGAPRPAPASVDGLATEVRRFYTEAGRPDLAGGQLELTIDPAAQLIVDDEMATLVERWKPTSATVIVLEPGTGQLRALGGYPSALLGVQRASEPASTIKPLTVAAALEEHTVSGRLDLRDLLERSSNSATAQLAKLLGKAPLAHWLGRFHLGERPAVQLPGAAAGSLGTPTTWSEADTAHAAMGVNLRATPLQVAAAFATLAQGGAYLAPTLVKRITAADGRPLFTHTPRPEPVLDPETATRVLTMLESVVHGQHGTGRAAAVQDQRVAGKTGTSNKDGQVSATFVGTVPTSSPRFIILIALDTAQQDGRYAGTLTAPAFRRLATRLLALEN